MDGRERQFRANSVAIVMPRRERNALPGVKYASGARKTKHFATGCKVKDAAVYAIESDEDQEEIGVVRIQAIRP